MRKAASGEPSFLPGMTYTVYDVLVLLCAITISSYLFNFISVKLRVPAVILLIGSGLALRHASAYFHFAAPPSQAPLEFLGVLGLILIVLEGALDLKITRRNGMLIVRSFFSAVAVLLGTALSVAWLIQQMNDLSFTLALVYAVPLAVISSAIAIPSAGQLDAHKREFIIYESTFSDVCGIMLFNYVIAENMLSLQSFGQFSLNAGLILLVSVVSTALLLWLFNHLGGHSKIFLIFSLLILVYVFGKALHLPSLLLILVFGLVINNIQPYLYGRLGRLLHPEKLAAVSAELKTMTRELAFLIRTFFFLLFGFNIDLQVLASPGVIGQGLVIVLCIMAIRALTLRFISKINVFPELFIAPRGLITILLFYSIPAHLQTDRFDEGVLIFVILATAVIMGLGILFTRKSYREADDLVLTGRSEALHLGTDGDGMAPSPETVREAAD